MTLFSAKGLTVRKMLFLSFVLIETRSRLPAQVLDEVTVKDGSRIVGEILRMTEGVLSVNTAFGGQVKVNWNEVTSLKTTRAMPFILKDGSELIGVAQGGKEGTIDVKAGDIQQPVTVALSSISAINAKKNPIAYKGNLSIGVSISDGNTNNKTASLLGDFEARGERQRLTMNGTYNYAENQAGLTQRNGKAGIKYDFFITKRFYAYEGALFEHDTFQDLSLRSAFSAGPGYQFIDKGDFVQDFLKELQLYGEAGLSYVDEDRKTGEDARFVSARWAVRLDWPIVPKRVTFFHRHEGYPSLERASDLFLLTEQGVRFAIWSNFIATLQVNWRWDNTPTPGFERSDTLYLLTLGYSFEL